ncbi:MAG: hypothetical protein ACRC1K_22035, partial [Planctomycetia bacterium]
RPGWRVTAAVLRGKHTALGAAADRVVVLDDESPDPAAYEAVFPLRWWEWDGALPTAAVPATKVERCLRDVFQIEPTADLSGYVLPVDAAAVERARCWLERTLRGVAPWTGGDGAKAPVVLLHYEGNTSTSRKNLTHDDARRLARWIRERGLTPVVLDWDDRSPLAKEGLAARPEPRDALWPTPGVGDAATLAALIGWGRAFVGIDSGPQKVAAAVAATPAVGVWTGHHPLHYCAPAAHMVHIVPEDHVRLLRVDRDAGGRRFAELYRHEKYGAGRRVDAVLKAMGEALDAGG